jgi:hypothetical protein
MLNQDSSQRPPRYILIAWFSSALITLCLSAFGRPLQHWVYNNIGEATIAWLIGLLLFGLGVTAICWQAKRGLKGNRYTLVVITIALVVTLITITTVLPQTEERLHFATFGLFGFFSKRLFPTWLAILVILILSSGDELFQAWLPDRVGDWRDVGINITAGIIGLGFAWAGLAKDPSRIT